MQTLVELFDKKYINTVEIPFGNRSSSLGYPSDPKCGKHMIKAIISKYSTHQSVEKIKESLLKNKGRTLFCLQEEQVK